MLTKEDIQRILFCIDLVIQSYGENKELEKIYQKLIEVKENYESIGIVCRNAINK